MSKIIGVKNLTGQTIVATKEAKENEKKTVNLVKDFTISARVKIVEPSPHFSEKMEIHSPASPADTELATPKQLFFIKNLAAEKQVNKISEITGVQVAENSIPTKRQASDIIERLMSL